jgi:hypothetical protein
MRYAACLALLVLSGCSAPETTSWLGYIEGERVLEESAQRGDDPVRAAMTSQDLFAIHDGAFERLPVIDDDEFSH